MAGAFDADADVGDLLGLKTWAVVGLSNNAARAAFGVARNLLATGHRVVPVHPKAETVHGQPGFASLADVPFPVDVVDVFVNSDLAPAVVKEALDIGARGVWLQLGVTVPAAQVLLMRASACAAQRGVRICACMRTHVCARVCRSRKPRRGACC